jgi:hypothetical protein
VNNFEIIYEKLVIFPSFLIPPKKNKGRIKEKEKAKPIFN